LLSLEPWESICSCTTTQTLRRQRRLSHRRSSEIERAGTRLACASTPSRPGSRCGKGTCPSRPARGRGSPPAGGIVEAMGAKISTVRNPAIPRTATGRNFRLEKRPRRLRAVARCQITAAAPQLASQRLARIPLPLSRSQPRRRRLQLRQAISRACAPDTGVGCDHVPGHRRGVE
jgi:hypothetical protein